MANSLYNNDDFFRVIGRISVTFATWDLFLSDILVRLRPGKPLCFKETDTLGRKLQRLEALKRKEVCDPHLLDELVAHLPKAKSIAHERNRYIHDLWVFDEDLIASGRIRRGVLTFKPDIHIERKELTIQELESFCEAIWSIQKPFADAAQKLHPGVFNVSDT